MAKANIAFVINKNYIGQFKVTFYSLVNSNKDIEAVIHLLQSDLDEADKADLVRFVRFLNAEIVFYQIDDRLFEGLPKMGYDNSYTAYYKTLLPYYLSSLGGKVLFLDCDIIVRRSILDLFQFDTNAFISCVEDIKINRKRKEHKQKIIENTNATYFNSGVMLFDFAHSDKIIPREKLVEYISQNKDIIRWHDQDILNHFYAAECYSLEEKYNYLTTYKSIWDAICAKGKRQAVIVHYANWKPWKSNYIGKYYKLYKKHYLALTGEKGVDFLAKRHFSAQLKLIFSYLLR